MHRYLRWLLRPVLGLVSGLELRSTGKWVVLPAMVGVVAGLGAIAFQFLLHVVTHFGLGEFAGYFPGEAAAEPKWAWLASVASAPVPWKLLLLLAAGGIVSGFLVYTFAPEAEGHGTDAAIEAFHHKRGKVRPRIPLIKMLASAVTIGTGGSGGREGPIAQIGAGFGSFLADRLHLSARDRRLMLAAGMGAGVGAIFRAPLAGALFAGEILYREAEFEMDAVVPAAISSIVGYCVYSLVLPWDLRFAPLFGEGVQYRFGSLLELVPLTVFSIVLVAAGVLYIKTFYGIHGIFARVPVKKHFRPAIGALLAGLVGLGLFHFFDGDVRSLAVLATGYGAIQEAVSPGPGLGVDLLLAIAFGKILTTSLTIGSGGSGGVFGPSMVIGGSLGAAAGQFLHKLWPSVVQHPQAYVIVGMAGFFAGIAHAPFSTIIMVSEMTGDYRLLLPSLWVSTLSFLLSRRWTLYVKQVPTRLDSPAHRGDFIVDVLAGIRVKDVYRPLTSEVKLIRQNMPLREIVQVLPETRQNYFPVVDESGRMVGVFSESDVRRFIYDEKIWEVAVAGDIMVGDFLFVYPHDDLNRAMRRLTQRNIDELPVLDASEPGKLLGMLRRKETIAFYNKRLEEMQNASRE